MGHCKSSTYRLSYHQVPTSTYCTYNTVQYQSYLINNIFLDPSTWTEAQVMQWAQWIAKEYQLPINIQLFQVFVSKYISNNHVHCAW